MPPLSAGLIESPASPDNAVRLWTASLDSLSSTELAELERLLDDSERTRAARFHFAHDRRHYVAARGLLRRLLGTTLQISPESVRLDYGARGKPCVTDVAHDGRHLCFNLSHSGGMAMFATAWERELGIDLESTKRLSADAGHLEGLAARVLAARELSLWRDLPDEAARHRTFLRAWTRKEAYAKATGLGIFDGLREIEVVLDSAAPESSLVLAETADEAPHGWTLYDLRVPDDFAAALAVARTAA